MNPIENIFDIMKKDIDNQMLCKNKICGCECLERGILEQKTS